MSLVERHAARILYTQTLIIIALILLLVGLLTASKHAGHTTIQLSAPTITTQDSPAQAQTLPAQNKTAPSAASITQTI